MSNNQLTTTPHKTTKSKLDQFSLGFEMNKTWAEARKDYVASKK